MQVDYGSSLVAQYSSSCSPFEEDMSYHSSNAEDDLMGILSSDLLVPQTAGHQLEISEHWSEIHGLDSYSTQKISYTYNTRRNRPQRVPSLEQPLPRNIRNNKGARVPPSGRNNGKKTCPTFKRKVFVHTLIYPKGRGVSEDDSMAMGDEWGTERDPGFEDCQEEMLFSNKKKKKDRKQGIQCVSNEISNIHRSFPKPILNSTPRHSRPLHSRPIRAKRSSKKDNQLCSGDISTQDTTTPAPNSSDSDSEDKQTVDSNTTEMSHSNNAATHLTVLPILLSNTTVPTQQTNSSTDSEHNMDTPKSPRIPSTPKLPHIITDYSEPSRTSSEEENKNKTEIIPERPPSVILHDSMPPPSLDKAPIYSVPVKPSSYTLKYQRKRSYSTSGIKCMGAPPVPPKPARYMTTKPPLLTPDRKLSMSFSTSDLSKIAPPRRPAPNPPSVATEQHTPVADDHLNENWSSAETSILPPPPPTRNDNTQIMPQEEFESIHFSEHLNLKRTRSVDNTNKINNSATFDSLVDDNFDSLVDDNFNSGLVLDNTDSQDKKIHRKDAINYDVSRTKSLNFGLNDIDIFAPMPGHQPPLTTIGYLPNSMQDSIDNPEEIIQMLNKIAKEKNMKIEISNYTTQESELSVPPLQMCSSANLSASNYEDCKGKKFKLVLTFHQIPDNNQDNRKKSVTTIRRVNVPLWSHQNKVKAAGLVKELSVREIKRQEAMYELYSTEVSYKLSLSILAKFRNDSRLNPFLPDEYRVLTKTDHTHLFSSTVAMLECSTFFASNLTKIVDSSLVIESVTDIILKNMSMFHCFVPYCKNQYYQNQKYKELMKNNPKFVEIITQLERDKECHNLDLTSFLMLPVQRITRLPLLLSNILEYTSEQHDNYQSVKTALFKLQEIAYRCDVEAHRLSSLEGLHAVSRSLVYPHHIKTLPIVDPKRHLVRQGELFRVQWRMRKLMKPEIKFERIYLLLFTDIAILTQLPKKCLKGDSETYQVIDYCKRQLLTYRPIGIINKQPFPTRNRDNFYMMSRWVVSRRLIPNAFAINMLENHRGRDACYLLVPNDPTEATRWVQAISPPLIPCMPGEQLYHEFEYPQFQAISNYTAQLPDELSLDIGDVVSIRRKMPDGWFEGERMRDDRHGWFPSSHAVEVMNESTRNKNVRKAQELRRISTLVKYSDIV